mgnify:CR=1 FL=1
MLKEPVRQKIACFHVVQLEVSSDSKCSRTILMNEEIEGAHCACERIAQAEQF